MTGAPYRWRFSGQDLARHREAFSWTREELAEHVGCSAATLQELEDGGQVPTLSLFLALVDVLEVAPEGLLESVPSAGDGAALAGA